MGGDDAKKKVSPIIQCSMLRQTKRNVLRHPQPFPINRKFSISAETRRLSTV